MKPNATFLISPDNLYKNRKNNKHEKLQSFEEYIYKKEFQKGTPVWLNVYHLTCLNYFLQLIGLGIYHTTIEIESLEYSFGSCNEDIAGFYINDRGDISKILTLKEKIYMGNTIYNKNNIDRILALESPFWMGRTYDPFLKNCNHFTKYFLKLILFKNIKYPVYINRICRYATVFSSFYPPIKRLYGNLHKRETCGSVSYLTEEINYYLKKNNNNLKIINKDNTYNEDDSINDNSGNIIPFDFNSLKDNEKYLEKYNKDNKDKDIKNNINDNSSSLSEETISRINLYAPKLVRIMNKNPFLFPLNYTSIYQTQIQGNKNIDIKIESIYNFFKILQETNDKLVLIGKINPNINSLFNISNANEIYQLNKFNKNELNKIDENIESCKFLLGILIEDKSFHNKNIKINFDLFIKDNYNIFGKNLKLIDIEIFLSLKILHMSNFISFISKKFENQKNAVEKILLINQNDFYGLFSLSYIRLIESNIPESSELINSLLSKKEISSIPLYDYSLIYMKNIINEV